VFAGLQFSLQGRAKVSLRNNCEKNRDFSKILGYLGIFSFWGYFEIFGGILREKIENLRIDF